LFVCFLIDEVLGWQYSPVIEYLPSIHEALGSISSTSEKEKKERERMGRRGRG
jgi:hypothetical protein